MQIYGLFTLNHHGGSRVLTLMSGEGAEAALAHVTGTAGIVTKPRPGYLTQYCATGKGAFDRFIEANRITVLGKREWDEKKTELGDRIL